MPSSQRRIRDRQAFRGRQALLVISIAVVLPGCMTFFLSRGLGRENTIDRGSISGKLVRVDADNEVASFAKIGVAGASRSLLADSEGRFVVRGLTQGSWALSIVDDPNGDGWPERSRVLGVRVAALPHATGPADTVVGVQGDREATGVLLGDVSLERTGVVTGSVTFNGGGLPAGTLGQVIATRELRIEQFDLDNFETFALGAEDVTSIDSQGRYYFGGLGSGEVGLVAMLFSAGPAGAFGELLSVSPLGSVTVSPRPDTTVPPDEADTLDLTGDGITLLDETTTVALAITPPPTAPVLYIVYVPPGRQLPPCEIDPVPTTASYANTEFDYARVELVPQAQTTVQLSPPLGAWDLQVCDGTLPGLLRQQVAVRAQGNEVPLWGPVALGANLDRCSSWRQVEEAGSCEESSQCEALEGETRACRQTSERDPILGSPLFACFLRLENDCDGDGVSGLPLAAFEPLLWEQECSVCSGLTGTELNTVTCEVAAQMGEGTQRAAATYDCDDDGDGQADIDEPACYGEGLGSDLDLDGLCSPVDPFPLCGDNDATLCVAGRNDASSAEGNGSDVIPEGCDPQYCALDCGFEEVAVCTQNGLCECAAQSCTALVTYKGTLSSPLQFPTLSNPRIECVDGDVSLTEMLINADTLLATLDQVQVIAGSLDLDATDVTVIDLPELRQIDGQLSITNNADLTTVTLGNLAVGGNVAISGNAMLCQDDVFQLRIMLADGSAIREFGNSCADGCPTLCESPPTNTEGTLFCTGATCEAEAQ